MDKSVNIEISPELEWVRPYVKMVSSYIPKNKKITKIHLCRLQKYKRNDFWGLCTTPDNRNYAISIYKDYWSIKSWSKKPSERKRVAKRFSKLDILQTLIHEIAHVTHWDHTPARMALECKMMARVCKQLEKEGYVSEEDEMKEFKQSKDIARLKELK